MSCHIQYILRLSTYVIRTRVTDKRKSEHYWGVQCAVQCNVHWAAHHMPPRIPNPEFQFLPNPSQSGRLVFAMYCLAKKNRKIRNWEFVKIWGEQLALVCTTSKLWITLDMLWSFKLSLKAKRASNGLMFLFTVCAICWQNFVENERCYTSKKANILGPFQEQITFGPFSVNLNFFWWIIRNNEHKNLIDNYLCCVFVSSLSFESNRRSFAESLRALADCWTERIWNK